MCETIRTIRAHKFVTVWKNMRSVEDRRGWKNGIHILSIYEILKKFKIKNNSVVGVLHRL